MIKYEIKRIPKVEGFVFFEYEYKTVSKAEMITFQKEGWSFHRKKYFLVTSISDVWKSFSMDQKITVAGIVIGSIISIIALF